MDHSEFDKELIERLGETQDFAFDENQWDRLEAELDKKKEKRRPIAWWFWGTAASIILLLGFGYYSFLLNQKIDVLEKKITEISNIEKVKNANLNDSGQDVEVPVNNEVITNATNVENNIKQDIRQNNETSTEQIIDRNKAQSSFAVTKANDAIYFLNEEQKKSVVEDILVDGKNADAHLVLEVEEKQRPQIVNSVLDKISELIAENWKSIAELKNKEELLAAVNYPIFTPSEIAMPNPFRFKNISIGAFGQTGWRVASIANAENEISAEPISFMDVNSGVSYFDSQSESTDVQVWQYGLKSRIQFTHGWGLNFSLSKKIFNITQRTIGIVSQINAPIVNEFFKSEYDVISFGNISQQQWVFGAGVSYSPFWKWKVRPFVQVTPEFSWAVQLDENYQIEDRSALVDNPQIAPELLVDSYDRSFTNSVDKFQLRNINAELGVEGMMGKHFQWQATIGINTALKGSSQNFFNRYQTGAGLNYIF